MEKILQIIGAETVGADTVKVTCIPYTTDAVKKKRPSLMDIASGGAGIQELIQQTQEFQSQKSCFFCTIDEWRRLFKNRILSSIKVNIEIDQIMEDI